MNPWGLLAALSVLNITPGSGRGAPLEDQSRREPPQTSGSSPEGDGHVDLSAFLDNMKEDFLRSLNLSNVPSHERVRQEPPQFMIDLYNRYASDKSSIPASNIVRSFNLEDAAHVTLPEDPIERQLLFFNVSVPRHEEVTRAELRLHISSHLNAGVFLGFKGHMSIYDVLDGESMETSKASKSFLALKEIRTTGWEMFEVTAAVKRWVRTDKLKNRLEVVLEGNDDGEQGSHRRRMFHLSTDSKNVPILAVFSDDHSNGVKETKLEIKEMIGHEQESVMKKASRNNTGDEEEEDDDDGIEDKAFSAVGPQPASSRSKRSTASNICRKTSLRVNFKDIGWDSWIIFPKDYDAFECKGMCYFPLTDDVTPTKHAIVQTLMHLKNPKKASKACCVPTKLESISIMYKDDAGVATLKYHYDGMRVAECGCR
ncbi:growth/differentiation factor 2 [Ambystoma mexicanum]|uniref:growth/differentiation factor 2 n=1 Tax=Ambystoma mexicanum TaxID=8296 RepID=UPI0037E71EC5